MLLWNFYCDKIKLNFIFLNVFYCSHFSFSLATFFLADKSTIFSWCNYFCYILYCSHFSFSLVNSFLLISIILINKYVNMFLDRQMFKLELILNFYASGFSLCAWLLIIFWIVSSLLIPWIIEESVCEAHIFSVVFHMLCFLNQDDYL